MELSNLKALSRKLTKKMQEMTITITMKMRKTDQDLNLSQIYQLKKKR